MDTQEQTTVPGTDINPTKAHREKKAKAKEEEIMKKSQAKHEKAAKLGLTDKPKAPKASKPKAPKAPKAKSADFKVTKEMKRSDGEVDGRKVPKENRPKPSSGQSRESFDLAADKLNPHQRKIVKAIEGQMTVLELVEATKLTALQVRNAIRNLVPGGWFERMDRATYKITPSGAGKRRAL